MIEPNEKPSAGRPKFSWSALPRWKKGLLVSAATLFVGGGTLKAYSFVQSKSDAPRTVHSDPSKKSVGPELGNSLVDGPASRGAGTEFPEEAGQVEPSTAESLSPALMKGGLGFFLGFCMGYAVRTFFRVSAFVIGVGALLVFGLMYAGILPQPDWASLSEHFNNLVASLKNQATGFTKFIEGNLHSTGAAAAGAFTGFKKN